MDNYNLTLGPILIGSFLNVFFYGISILQFFNYFWHYQGDKPKIKIVIMFLLLLDSLGTFFDIEMSYNYLVTNFGNQNGVHVLNIGLSPYPILTAMTAWVVQTFYAWRLAVITKKRALPFAIYCLSFIQMLAGFGTAIGGIIVKDMSLLRAPGILAVALIWLFGNIISDVVLTFFFTLVMSKAGYYSYSDAVPRLLRGQSGALTATCTTGLVICYLVAPNTSLHLGFGIPLSKLYTNSLLAFLNLRDAWSSDLTEGQRHMGTMHSSVQTIPLSPVHIRTEVQSDANNQVNRSAKASTNGRDDDSEVGMNDSKGML